MYVFEAHKSNQSRYEFTFYRRISANAPSRSANKITIIILGALASTLSYSNKSLSICVRERRAQWTGAHSRRDRGRQWKGSKNAWLLCALQPTACDFNQCRIIKRAQPGAAIAISMGAAISHSTCSAAEGAFTLQLRSQPRAAARASGAHFSRDSNQEPVRARDASESHTSN